MAWAKSTFAPRALALLALIALACASSGGSGDGAASPDDGSVDCATLSACADGLKCSGKDQCFKLKGCPGFVCTSAKVACKSDCAGRDCLLLESQPMMLSCR